MPLPRKFKNPLELTYEQVEQPSYVWLTPMEYEGEAGPMIPVTRPDHGKRLVAPDRYAAVMRRSGCSESGAGAVRACTAV